MPKQIFVNLPVADLDRSVAFFTGLGFSFNPQFTDKNATCMIIGENIHAMLLVRDYFKTFCSKPVADASKATEVLIALNCDSRAEVEAMVEKALAAGGTAPRKAQDHGFMYQHGFDDLDGHAWEVFYMNPEAMGGAQ
ncbi:Predicted lactoylglutathione lyase [Bordetella ansorpii]|uniref:Predicted lactoylglutathione lyase n=1 Tax=Bordetella ansorpii TaxID=288768 RepID=A0A157SNZ7_9BORD|nr:VOC family protein [Bordetella ansorpii]SAI71606.1 Predicted lactoylglutathione lyase [Bordetella ansorpii]